MAQGVVAVGAGVEAREDVDGGGVQGCESHRATIAPGFLEAAARLHRERPALRFVLPLAPGLRGLVEPLVARHAAGVPLQLLEGQSHTALAACDLTLIASGTATLEAALFKRPMVIGYRMHPLSWQLMKRMGYQPWVGLPNILCRDFVVPDDVKAVAVGVLGHRLALRPDQWIRGVRADDVVARCLAEVSPPAPRERA